MAGGGPPLVSVVVAAYNAAAHIRETLDSALAQRYPNLEVIVADDGSTDETATIVAGYAARDRRVRLLRQHNAGVGTARNAAIVVSRGDYVAPLDADDLWEPDKIAEEVAALEAAGSRAGFAYCWVRTVDAKGRKLGLQPACSLSGRVATALLVGNFLHNASVPLFRREALDAAGLYASREDQGGVQGCEDWDLLLRVAERFEVRVVPRILVSYRVGGSGMSFNVAGMERSYHWLVARVRRRRPEIPEAVFRWSEGQFYLYLALRARLAGQFRETRRCLCAAARADPATLLAPVLSYSWCVSWYRQWFPRGNRAVLDPAARAVRPPRARAPADHWRIKSLANAEVLWLLHGRVERRRFERWIQTSLS